MFQTRLDIHRDFKHIFDFIEYDDIMCEDMCQLERTFAECGGCMWSKYDRINLNSLYITAGLPPILKV